MTCNAASNRLDSGSDAAKSPEARKRSKEAKARQRRNHEREMARMEAVNQERQTKARHAAEWLHGQLGASYDEFALMLAGAGPYEFRTAVAELAKPPQ